MPVKIGGGRHLQEYDPSNGRYGSSISTSKQSRNSHAKPFTTLRTNKRYFGNSSQMRSLKDNITRANRFFPLKNGFFGDDEDGHNYIRHISQKKNSKTIQKLFVLLSYGGIELKKLRNGVIVRMKDGAILTYRSVSTSDHNESLMINTKKVINSQVKNQKIHYKGFKK